MSDISLKIGDSSKKKLGMGVIALFITAVILWFVAMYSGNQVLLRGTSVFLGIALTFGAMGYIMMKSGGTVQQAAEATQQDVEPGEKWGLFKAGANIAGLAFAPFAWAYGKVRPEKKPCTLKIKVADADSGAGIPGAQIILQPGWLWNTRKVVTNENGEASIETYQGKWKIKVSKANHKFSHPRGGSRWFAEIVVCDKEEVTHTTYLKKTKELGEVKVKVLNFATKEPVAHPEVEFNSGYILNGEKKPAPDGTAVFEGVKGKKYPIRVRKTGYEQCDPNGKPQKYTYAPTGEEETAVYLKDVSKVGEAPAPGSPEEGSEIELIKIMSEQMRFAAEEFKRWCDDEVQGHPDPRGRLHYCAGMLGGEQQLHHRFLFAPRKYPVLKYGLPSDYKTKVVEYISAVEGSYKRMDVTDESRTFVTRIGEALGKMKTDGVFGFISGGIKNRFGDLEDFGYETFNEFSEQPFLQTSALTAARIGLTPVRWMLAPLGFFSKTARIIVNTDLIPYENPILPRSITATDRILHYFNHMLAAIPGHSAGDGALSNMSAHGISQLEYATKIMEECKEKKRKVGEAPVADSDEETAEIDALTKIAQNAQFIGDEAVTDTPFLHLIDNIENALDPIADVGLTVNAIDAIKAFMENVLTFCKKSETHKNDHPDAVEIILRILNLFPVHLPSEHDKLKDAEERALAVIARVNLPDVESTEEKQLKVIRGETAEGPIADMHKELQTKFEALEVANWEESVRELNKLRRMVQSCADDQALFPKKPKLDAAELLFEKLNNEAQKHKSPLINPKVSLTRDDIRPLLDGIIETRRDRDGMARTIAGMTSEQREDLLIQLEEEGKTDTSQQGNTIMVMQNNKPVQSTRAYAIGNASGAQHPIGSNIPSEIRKFAKALGPLITAYETEYSKIANKLSVRRNAQTQLVDLKDDFTKRMDFEDKVHKLAEKLDEIFTAEVALTEAIENSVARIYPIAVEFSNLQKDTKHHARQFVEEIIKIIMR